jgi:nickel-dependent lactate racemase
MELELPYGRTPLRFTADARYIDVLRAPELPAPRPLDALLAEALARPVDAPPLARLARTGARVTVIVSDSTRDEPRAAFLAALRRELADTPIRWTIAIATGTHGPCAPSDVPDGPRTALDAIGIPRALVDDTAVVVDHDGHSDRDLVELGTTRRGTPVRVHRCVVESDLVIATGCIRPHYFAGFGAGVKALFPGLGQATAIRINHRLKTEPRARAGIVDGNPCRDDLEEAVRFVQTPTFLLNGICGPDGRIHAAVAGDLVAAFRGGAELARPWFTVRARPAPLVIASDVLPVTASLYQASKIAAAVAPLVEANGEIVVAAECPDGIGPLDTVNEAILRIGILPRLPVGARISLLSSMSPSIVGRTLVRPLDAIPPITARTLVVPRASQLLCEAS